MAEKHRSRNGDVCFRSECSSCKRSRLQYPKDNRKLYRLHFTLEEVMRGCKCGFIPLHPCQMDTHHIDGNHKNNDRDNLELLCANCHRLERINQ